MHLICGRICTFSGCAPMVLWLGKVGLGDFWSPSRSNILDLLYCLVDYSEVQSLKCLDRTLLCPDLPCGQPAPLICLVMLCHYHEIRTVWPQAAFLSTALLSSSSRWVYFWTSGSSCRRHSLLRISGLGIKSAQRLATAYAWGLYGFVFFSEQSFTI